MTPAVSGCAAALAVLLVAVSPQAAAAQWWKEPATSRLDKKSVAGATAARVKWDDGYIEVQAGATADPALALNRAHEQGLARDAARQLAYFKLAEIVEGVAIDGTTIVKNAMVTDQTVRATVQGRIKGAVVVQETVRDVPGGGVWAEVVMGLRLRGPGSLAESVRGWAAARPADGFAGDGAFRVSGAYTGVVVDASDAPFSPALSPRLLEEGSSKVVFGPHVVEPAAFAQQGPVGYAVSLPEAVRSGRVGANPLIVRAVAASGGQQGDLVLSRNDAERVLAAERAGGVLGRAAVTVVMGRERSELAARAGRRHALLVGIDDYQQGGPGGASRLSFAARDAASLGQALARRGGFASDAVTVLDDRNATRAAVLAALERLRAVVREEDSVVLFFSGHGSMGPGEDARPHYYLVPWDGRLDDLAGTALMDQHLEELLGQLPAREVVVILDACYSGGGAAMIRGLSARSAVTPPARPPLEATVGRVVISASRPEQPAYEDAQRGGGLLTSYVVEGLDGAADLDGDGRVTVLELFQFVSPRVREFSRQHYPSEQTPVLEVRGLSGEIVLARRP